MNFKEAILYEVWSSGMFSGKNLKTADGLNIHVLSPGSRNDHSGPDFSEAIIEIDGAVWIGNVEIHKSTSDWLAHGHERDRSYENVILHVVYNHDLVQGVDIPVLELSRHLSDKVLLRFQELSENQYWVRCANHVCDVPESIILDWLNYLSTQRLEYKSKEIEGFLHETNGNWNEVFYLILAKNFGFKTNAFPFEWMARNTPFNIVQKHKGSLASLEALFFGQAGLLEDEKIDLPYHVELREAYKWQCLKYDLKRIEGHVWKFMRMRPLNFPTIRIAQFASLICKHESLVTEVMQSDDVAALSKLFNCSASEFWKVHYSFTRTSPSRDKSIGRSAIENLLINTVVPFIYTYGIKRGRPDLTDKAQKMLQEIPPEQNSIIENWMKIGVTSRNAAHSQALLHLKRVYCNRKKCLNCDIGKYLTSY